MNERILLVEDEPGLITTLGDYLTSEGYRFQSAQNGEEGLAYAIKEPFDLIVLDVMLPYKSGLDVCRDLRQQGFATPVLMLTARGQVTDRVLGLKIGADDYLIKPFDMLELLARIEALLRRGRQKSGGASFVYEFGNIRVDTCCTEVRLDGTPVALSAREFQLLRHLIEHRGETLSRKKLLGEVWGYHGARLTRTVDVHVASLRRKLERDPANPKFILTVLGFGYKFAG
jgi:two-component system alkaline phosphatase synthesis response regulator PhoP